MRAYTAMQLISIFSLKNNVPTPDLKRTTIAAIQSTVLAADFVIIYVDWSNERLF